MEQMVRAHANAAHWVQSDPGGRPTHGEPGQIYHKYDMVIPSGFEARELLTKIGIARFKPDLPIGWSLA